MIMSHRLRLPDFFALGQSSEENVMLFISLHNIREHV